MVCANIPIKEILDKHQQRVDDLQSQADDLDQQARDLHRRAKDLRSRRDGVLESMQILKAHGQDEEEKEQDNSPTRNQREVDPRADLSGLVVDLSKCVNLLERIISIAKAAPDKLLNTSVLTRYLLDNGHSSSKLKNLRTAVHRVLTGRPELFEKVDQGMFRYQPHVAQEEFIEA